MINFQKIVEGLLTTEATATFIQNLMNFYDRKYDPAYKFPIPGTNARFENDVEQTIFIRGTQNAFLTPELRDHYPYIDYLCYVNEQEKKIKNRNINIKDLPTLPNIDTYTSDYIKAANSSFKGTVGQMYPVITYYQPVSYYVKGLHDKVLSALVSTGLIGRIAFDNYVNKNYTLSEAINDTVVLRQQTVSRSRPKSSSKNVDDFIMDYKSYLPGGGKNVPSEFSKNTQAYIALAESIEKYAAALPKGSATVADVLRSPVRTISADVPRATEIVKNLKNLADFIPEKPTAGNNYAAVGDALAKVAQGLSLGVPTLGGKR